MIQENEEYWEQVVDEASALFKRYENVPEKEFAKQLILTVLDELERIYKDMPKKHG